LFKSIISSSFIVDCLVINHQPLLNNEFFSFVIFSSDIHLLDKLIERTSVLTIECFQHLIHSISILIVVHAAHIISILASFTPELHSGHLYDLINDSIIHFSDW
jgi:hypothetical protein